MDITVRKMTPDDVGAVYGIETCCFKSEAWTREDFEALAGGFGGEVFTALVADIGGAVCGYICGNCVAGEMEIGSVAVSDEYRRRGIARRLITELERLTVPEKAFLEVRLSNSPARALYETVGFKEIAIRRRYYDNPPEDAIVMEKIYNIEKK